ncbi:MAG: alpha/beta fold hydrolase [Candidatus Kaiserbacteria bacterium]|nr:alpha/beta fold hydrolase [Candidatus Kaiserbacteria bacterium]
MKYDHRKIEKKWREKWDASHAYATNIDAARPKYYVLDMFPYPSGAGLHVGHPKGYIASDIIARKKRMEGFRVLHPMGWDAFGLPAENYAIKTGTPPQKTTDESIATFKTQISNLSLSYDWDREIGSHRSDYYKWTQWLFTKFFDRGLVYKKKALVNWDPIDQTVLANEQVLPDGTAERSGAVVEKKELEQWFYKITDYADELVDKLETIDWPESTKINQRNWIGRSEGAEIDFGLDMPKKYKFVILHGFEGKPEMPRWQWVKAKLEELGHEVILPELPNTNDPSEKEQVAVALAATTYNANTVLVGHSLGAAVALKVAEKLRTPIARLVTIGGFIDTAFKDKPRKFEKRFTWEFNGKAIRDNVRSFTVLQDPRDYAVSDEQAARLAELLDVPVTLGNSNEPHFTGETEPDVLLWLRPTIRVFTTRADTLFGATYLVLAPEHPWVTRALEHKTVLKNNDEVAAYVQKAKQKSDIERLATDKEKTGVRLEGVSAVNPATGEKIPLYVADYVLAHYGTGAVMGVPAHDDRDYEFAKKYELPIHEVVEPLFKRTSGVDGLKPNLPIERREAVDAIIRNPKDGRYLVLQWKNLPWVTFVTGGVENESAESAIEREIIEETGYKNIRLVRPLGGALNAQFYHVNKKSNRWAHVRGFYFELTDDVQEPLSEDEAAIHEVLWLTKEEVEKQLTVPDMQALWRRYLGREEAYTGEGILVASGEFDGMTTEEARAAITQRFGRRKKTYRLRDWLISRQRYWGAPIPIVYDPEGKPHAIPEEHLPWLLPTDVEYLPKGTSPLGSSKELVERTERIFGKGWRPEIDTMDTFACSSWYFLRFADPHNEKEFASKQAIEEWLPVDLYIGGAEHTVLHLMYARFFVKALRDMSYLKFDEPFLKLRHQGLIVAEDGRKMSKRYGNVINPDDIVETYGADTLRVYEMFMGPFQDSIAWNTQSMIGARRFLERVWRAAELVKEANEIDDEKYKTVDAVLHRSIKKIGEDIDAFKFNTAVSQLMILLNTIEKEKQVGRAQWEAYLQLLAPFAPHISEELWHLLGQGDSIHSTDWPTYDEKLLVSETVVYAIQIDGKLRGQVEVASDTDKAAVESAAKDAVAERLAGEEIARTVVVPGKLVNFVLKR